MESGPIIGRMLLVAGLVLAVLGAVMAFGERIPLLGKLPGDITIERGSTRIVLPITTSILLSVLLSLLLWLLSLFKGK